MEHYDAVIIGSGQGGTPLSKKLAQAGWKTALIEKQFIGGTCVNTGCTPTKTLIASAKVAYTVAQASKWGVDVPDYRINLPAILNRKTEVVNSFRNGSQQGLQSTDHLTLIFGEAFFTGKKQIQIKLPAGDSQTITADKLFIDAGTSPRVPDIPGLAQAGYFTSTTLLDLEELPAHLLILGGNYIALEFGQMYRRFGSQVTILEQNEQLLKKEDEDVAAVVRQFLEQEAIQILTQTRATKVTRTKAGLQVTITSAGKEKEIVCSHILVATGRTPNTQFLNLSAAGVKTDSKGYIVVNEKLETTAPDIYALGDITGGPKFTHISYNDYVILYRNLLEEQNRTTTHRLAPYCLFTDPQVGRIGLTEKEAREQGLPIKVAKLPMTSVARALETGDTRGLLKAVVNAETNQIIGVAVVGQEGGEIMSVLQMAMVGKIDYKQIKEMVFAHPLYAESLNNLFLALDKPK